MSDEAQPQIESAKNSVAICLMEALDDNIPVAKQRARESILLEMELRLA